MRGGGGASAARDEGPFEESFIQFWNRHFAGILKNNDMWGVSSLLFGAIPPAGGKDISARIGFIVSLGGGEGGGFGASPSVPQSTTRPEHARVHFFFWKQTD